MSSSDEQVGLEIKRAEKAWRAASTLFESGLYEDSVSRAYYAVLHAAKAALATFGMFPTTHRAVRRMFGFHLIKSSAEKDWTMRAGSSTGSTNT